MYLLWHTSLKTQLTTKKCCLQSSELGQQSQAYYTPQNQNQAKNFQRNPWDSPSVYYGEKDVYGIDIAPLSIFENQSFIFGDKIYS